MPYQFYESEQEPEPQASGSREGGPPRKLTSADVLDSPFPAKRPPNSSFSVALLVRIVAGILLALIAGGTIILIFGEI